jgi:hypothetical protein
MRGWVKRHGLPMPPRNPFSGLPHHLPLATCRDAGACCPRARSPKCLTRFAGQQGSPAGRRPFGAPATPPGDAWAAERLLAGGPCVRRGPCVRSDKGAGGAHEEEVLEADAEVTIVDVLPCELTQQGIQRPARPLVPPQPLYVQRTLLLLLRGRGAGCGTGSRGAGQVAPSHPPFFRTGVDSS